MKKRRITLSASDAHLARLALDTELEWLRRPRDGHVEGLAELTRKCEALRARLNGFVRSATGLDLP